ncbi:MAG: 2-oxoglutarate oxidoreductase [Lachnospiraceae bacterium]|nr:2-oxoglutarate oxidoreductase [Lachnospiraceae bacterium]
MSVVFEKTKGLADVKTHYCPGCSHGIVHRLLAECLEEMGELDNAINVSPVGCAVLALDYFNFDGIQAAHGRAPATATGIKRVHPDKIVTTYQGDGDLASIGMCEIVHAAARGEKITTIFINNGIYGMTGGQMAPTTLPGMKATTAPYGRDVSINGYPIRVSEMLSTLDGAKYIERVSVDSPANVIKAKKAIRRALEVQKAGEGFSLVEVMCSCPTNWGKTPVDSMQFIRDEMIPYYPLGVYKDTTKEAK